MYSGYAIAFNGKCSWSFSDGFARNVIIFGVDNNSSSYSDNLKHDVSVLGKEDTFVINGSLGALEKN